MIYAVIIPLISYYERYIQGIEVPGMEKKTPQ